MAVTVKIPAPLEVGTKKIFLEPDAGREMAHPHQVMPVLLQAMQAPHEMDRHFVRAARAVRSQVAPEAASADSSN